MRDLSSPFWRRVWRWVNVDSSLSGLVLMKAARVGNDVGTAAFLPSLGGGATVVAADANRAYCGPYNSNLRGEVNLDGNVAKRSSTTREPTEWTASLVICFLRL